MCSSINMAKMILEKTTNIENKNFIDGQSVLMEGKAKANSIYFLELIFFFKAIEAGQIEIVKELCKRGADENCRDYNGLNSFDHGLLFYIFLNENFYLNYFQKASILNKS